MSERSRHGESIDSRKIDKHLADLVALSGLLQPGQAIEAPAKTKADIERFLLAAQATAVGIGHKVARRIAKAYATNLAPVWPILHWPVARHV